MKMDAEMAAEMGDKGSETSGRGKKGRKKHGRKGSKRGLFGRKK